MADATSSPASPDGSGRHLSDGGRPIDGGPPTDPPVRLALIGCGMIGQIHADGLRRLAEEGEIDPVVAADPSAEALAAAGRNCPFGRRTNDPAEVMGDEDVEAVLIATPTSSHKELLLGCLEAGKAVFCEKPLAPSFADVRAMCDAAKGAEKPCQVGFHARFHPILNELERTVRTGELGRPMAYSLRDDQYWPTGDVVPGHSSWRSQRTMAGGGALIEHSVHAADIVCWLFGPVRRVFAATRSVFGYDVEDVAAVTVEHASGTIGTLLTVFNGVRGREERRFEVFCEAGTVEATTDFIVGAAEDGYLVQRPDEGPQHLDLEALRARHFARLGLPRHDFLFYTYPAVRNWLQAVQRGAKAWPDFDDALRAHELVEAAYRSASAGVPIDPLLEFSN